MESGSVFGDLLADRVQKRREGHEYLAPVPDESREDRTDDMLRCASLPANDRALSS